MNDFSFDEYDVIVVGAGAAGLYASLCLPPHMRVALITKDTIDRSASDWAQGGIAAAIAPDDSPKLHIEDTLKAGAGLCDVEAVQYLATHAEACVRSLLSMGVAFDRRGPDLALTLEAAHSRRRVLHAADTTGRAIVSTLIEQVFKRPNIEVISNAFVLDLWLTSDRTVCRGVNVLCHHHIRWIAAQAVVLATGGGGQVFAQTTNPEVSTGDGVAMAWRAGAILRDLEFVQFHPTALTKEGAPRFLISEAVRGEGAHLIDDQGRRFAFDYHPSGELAPRDVVSRAIFDYLRPLHIAQPQHPAHVWLDLRPIPTDTIRHRFPNIIHVCQRWGVDVFNDPIPVAPAAHYWMGGIAVDLTSQSSIRNLYAVGETASTGVHGANRLASNSLLECLVFGAQLQSIALAEPPSPSLKRGEPFADDVVRGVKEASRVEPLILARSLDAPDMLDAMKSLEAIRRSLPALVWQSAGICRDHASLVEAIAQVESWQEAVNQNPIGAVVSDLQPSQLIRLESSAASHQIHDWAELRNLVDIAVLLLRSALFRTESRGGHYRTDYPVPQASWRAHTLVRGEKIWTSPNIHQ